jgi:hypothetical protein
MPRDRSSSLGGVDDAARSLGLETLAKMRQIQALKDKVRQQSGNSERMHSFVRCALAGI